MDRNNSKTFLREMIRTVFRSESIIERSLFQLNVAWDFVQVCACFQLSSCFCSLSKIFEWPTSLCFLCGVCVCGVGECVWVCVWVCVCVCVWTAREGFWNIYLGYFGYFCFCFVLFHFVLHGIPSPPPHKSTRFFFNCSPRLIYASVINGKYINCEFLFVVPQPLMMVVRFKYIPSTSKIRHEYKENLWWQMGMTLYRNPKWRP